MRENGGDLGLLISVEFGGGTRVWQLRRGVRAGVWGRRVVRVRGSEGARGEGEVGRGIGAVVVVECVK